MPMRAKQEVHRLSGYLRGLWGSPSTQNLFLSLFPSPLSASTLSKQLPEYRSLSISNNFQTHPVCNLLSTNEINPSENIFNNNVMQNGISKIVKSGRFIQFLKFILKSGRLQLHHVGGRIYVDIQSGTKELLLSSRKVHQSVSQIWREAGFFDRSEAI